MERDQLILAVIDLPLTIVRGPLRTGAPIPARAEELAERSTRALLAGVGHGQQMVIDRPPDGLGLSHLATLPDLTSVRHVEPEGAWDATRVPQRVELDIRGRPRYS